MSQLVYLGLGTNLGERLENLRDALREIGALRTTTVLRTSSVYETEPWGGVEQPAFLNAVAEVQTDLDPLSLLTEIKRIEFLLGRTKTVRWGPRLIDIDILIYDSMEVHGETLEIPHPRMCNRLFVLVPLAELNPDWDCPTGRTVVEVAAGLWDEKEIHKTTYDLSVGC